MNSPQHHPPSQIPMTDFSTLERHNIVLQTELRLLKSQLRDAQKGTQYLAQCSSAGSSLFALLDERLDRLETAFYSDRNDWVRTRTDTPMGLGKHSEFAPTGEFERPSSSGFGGAAAREQDLLFSDHGPVTPRTSDALDPFQSAAETELSGSILDSPINSSKSLGVLKTPGAPHNASKNEKSSGPVGSGVPSFENDEWEVLDPSWDKPNDSRNGETAHAAPALLPTVNTPPLAQQTLDTPFTSANVSQQRPNGSAFALHEHRRLMGAAMFIEDMSIAEREEHWQDLAWRSARHTAEEWQKYYEEFVRPGYLAKVARRTSSTDGIIVDGDEALIQLENYCGQEKCDSLVEAKPGDGLLRQKYLLRPIAPIRDMRLVLGQHDTLSNDKPAAGLNDTEPLLDLDLEDIHIQDSGIALVPERQARKALQTSFPPETSSTNEDAVIRGNIWSCDFPQTTQGRSRPPSRAFEGPKEVTDLFSEQHSDDKSLFRTVLISNIPPKIKLGDVLQKVRGGTIVSAILLRTSGMKSKPRLETNACFVVFLHAHEARAFVNFFTIRQFPFFWSVKCDAPMKATVSVLPSPSRPLHPKLLTDIRNGMTRVLFVVDEEGTWKAEEVADELFRCGVARPLIAERRSDETIVLEFAHIWDAAAAWQVVDRNRTFFGRVEKGFLPDPCTRSFEGR